MGAVVSQRASRKDIVTIPMMPPTLVDATPAAACLVAPSNGSASNGCIWHIVNPSLLLSERGTAIEAKHCGRKGGAVASPVMTEGTHTFTMVIERGTSGDVVGEGVYLGLADDTGYVSENAGGYAWGYSPQSGRVMGITNAMAGHWETEKYTPFNCMKNCSTAREINGATVAFTVDMDQHCFYVSVNGEPIVEAGVKLPASVRPWAQLEHNPDKIRLTEYHAVHTRIVQILAARSSPDVIRVSCVGVGGGELQAFDASPTDPLAQVCLQITKTLQQDGQQLRFVLPGGRLLPGLPGDSVTGATLAEAFGLGDMGYSESHSTERL